MDKVSRYIWPRHSDFWSIWTSCKRRWLCANKESFVEKKTTRGKRWPQWRTPEKEFIDRPRKKRQPVEKPRDLSKFTWGDCGRYFGKTSKSSKQPLFMEEATESFGDWESNFWVNKQRLSKPLLTSPVIERNRNLSRLQSLLETLWVGRNALVADWAKCLNCSNAHLIRVKLSNSFVNSMVVRKFYTVPRDQVKCLHAKRGFTV